MNEAPLAIVFLGSALPEEMCNAQPACSAAANRDVVSLLNAIKKIAGATPTIFSVLPIATFPRSSQLLIQARYLRLNDGELAFQLLPFINLPLFKQVTISIVNFIHVANWLWQHRGQNRCVIVHNVYPPMSIPVLVATRLFGGIAVVLVMDLPHDMSHDFRGLTGKLRRLNYLLETHLLPAFAGIIGYTELIATDFAPQTPFLVMEGGIDANAATTTDNKHESHASSAERIICFSGSLTDINGVNLLLDAFKLLPDPCYRLWIFGRGPLEPLVTSAAMLDERITYWGFVPQYIEVMRRMRSATVLINLRRGTDAINRYTFPSKLREYMLTGRPIITTITPSVPREYHDYVYVLRDETPPGLATAIQEACSLPSETLDDFGAKAQDFVVRNKNWSVQGQRVFEFLKGICNK